jgi:hypothetical protein
MRGKLWFLGGVAVGFVVGARAGRERYDQLVATARRMMDHPTVQEAAGVVQAQANRLYAEGKETVTEKLSHTKLGERLSHRAEPADELGLPGDLDPLGSSAKRPSERMP